MQEQDYGYDSGYDDDYRDPQPQGTTTYGSSSKIINHPAVAARHRTALHLCSSIQRIFLSSMSTLTCGIIVVRTA